MGTSQMMSVNKNEAIQKQAVKYITIVIVQKIVGLTCFLLAAGTLSDIRGWVYFLIDYTISILILVVMFTNHAEVLSERGKKHVNTKTGTKFF